MPDRPGFALLFADKTGLRPDVVYSWSKYENDDLHERRRPFNWLNWKLDVDIDEIPYVSLDPASDGGSFPGYASRDLAMQAAVKRLSSDRYAGIRSTVGKTAMEQYEAIRQSDWGTKALSPVTFPEKELKWCWVSWRLGRDWAHEFGPKNEDHRPEIFPRPVPLTWWAALAWAKARAVVQ